MAQQKKRAKKVSQGINGGGGKVRLTEMQKVLIGGGGLMASFKPIGHLRNGSPTQG